MTRAFGCRVEPIDVFLRFARQIRGFLYACAWVQGGSLVPSPLLAELLGPMAVLAKNTIDSHRYVLEAMISGEMERTGPIRLAMR